MKAKNLKIGDEFKTLRSEKTRKVKSIYNINDFSSSAPEHKDCLLIVGIDCKQTVLKYDEEIAIIS